MSALDLSIGFSSLSAELSVVLSLFLFRSRNREINRMKDGIKGGNGFAFLCHDSNELEHSNQVNLPRVSVVMPLKGFGEQNLHNWKSQITSLYGGPLEFLFLVESTEDPAYHAVSRLITDFKREWNLKEYLNIRG